jgi:hypothetical protein
MRSTVSLSRYERHFDLIDRHRVDTADQIRRVLAAHDAGDPRRGKTVAFFELGRKAAPPASPFASGCGPSRAPCGS